MDNAAALLRILYQNEILFQLDKDFNHELIEKPALTKISKLEVQSPTVVAERKTPPIEIREVIIEPAATFPELRHKILILIDEPKHQDLIISEALFLDNILRAVGHSVDSSDLLNYSFIPGQDARKVLYEKRTHFFITFGVPLIKLNLDLLLAPYTPKLVEGIWFLLTDALVVIEADRNLKKKLWQALQKMFQTN